MGKLGDWLQAGAKAALVFLLTGNPVLAAATMAASLYGANRKRAAQEDARRAYNRSQQDRTTMIRSGTEPRQILLGQDRLSGPMVYFTNSGTYKEFAHIVIALGGHPFESIGTVYFNEIALPDPDSNGFIQSGTFYKGGRPVDRVYTTPSPATTINLPFAPSAIVSVTRSDQAPYTELRESTIVPSGNYTVVGSTITITSGGAAYYTVNYRTMTGGKALVRIKKYLGDQTTADADLIAESGGEWTAAHVGYGVPYLYVRIEYDKDIFGSIQLPNISAVCKGAKPYDPRLNRNPAADLVGAVPGVPGTLPAKVGVSGFNSAHGVVREVVGSGTDKLTGLPYFDLKISGTASASSNFMITLPDSANVPSAASGQTWTARVTMRLLSGTWNLAGGSQLQLVSLTSGGAVTVEGSQSFPAMTVGATFVMSRTQALANASAAAVMTRVRFTYNSGTSYNLTIRILLPELFQGAIGSAADCRKWTDNAALATAWWFRNQQVGARSMWNEVPTDELVAEANICDEPVALVTGFQPRYTANGTLYADGTLRDNMEALLSSMAGMSCWAQGRWLIRAGAYETPDMTIDESCLAQGEIAIIPHAARRDLFNTITGKYTDASSGYIERQQPPVTNPVYVAADGGRQLTKDDMEHPLVRDGVRAQRLAKIELEGIRQAMSVTLTCNLKAYRAIPGRTVYLTLPSRNIVAKPMLVAGRRYLPSVRRIELSLIEISANTYAWNFGNATIVDPAPNSTTPPVFARPLAPTNVTAAATPFRSGLFGLNLPFAKVTWDASTQASVLVGGRVLVQVKRDDLDDWIDSGNLSGDTVTTTVGPYDSATPSLARVAFMDDKGRVSDWTPAVTPPPGVGGTGINTAMPPIAPSAKVWSGAATATLTIKPSGSITATGSPTVNYFNPATGTPGAGLWVRATKTGGNAVASGTYNTWQQINADRVWSLPGPAGTVKTCTIRYDFAATSGGTILASVVASFNADAVNDTGGGGGYFEP